MDDDDGDGDDGCDDGDYGDGVGVDPFPSWCYIKYAVNKTID